MRAPAFAFAFAFAGREGNAIASDLSLLRFNDEVTGLRARLVFAARQLPEATWPDASDAGIRALLPDVCVGVKSVDEANKLDWKGALLNQLAFKERKLLDDEVPERIGVPSGSLIAVDYVPAIADGGAPVLAVRLQELFGLADTPTVARGRVPLVLHLLSPGHKPVQVTRDLRSFWTNTYPEVRKEMRPRYPRHSWPDDPWTATPTSRAKRRGT